MLFPFGQVSPIGHRRVEAAGLPVGSRLSQVALALHETSGARKISSLLGIATENIEAARTDLFSERLVDFDNKLVGQLKIPPLGWDSGSDNAITAAYMCQCRH